MCAADQPFSVTWGPKITVHTAYSIYFQANHYDFLILKHRLQPSTRSDYPSSTHNHATA